MPRNLEQDLQDENEVTLRPRNEVVPDLTDEELERLTAPTQPVKPLSPVIDARMDAETYARRRGLLGPRGQPFIRWARNLRTYTLEEWDEHRKNFLSRRADARRESRGE